MALLDKHGYYGRLWRHRTRSESSQNVPGWSGAVWQSDGIRGRRTDDPSIPSARRSKDQVREERERPGVREPQGDRWPSHRWSIGRGYRYQPLLPGGRFLRPGRSQRWEFRWFRGECENWRLGDDNRRWLCDRSKQWAAAKWGRWEADTAEESAGL